LANVTNVTQLPLSYLDTDPTLAANSDTKVASQKAVKAYADSISGGAWAGITGKPTITVGDTGYATLDAILADPAVTAGTIVVPAGTHTLNASTDRTLKAGLNLMVLKGGVIAVPTARTFTLAGDFEAGLSQTFSCTGTGKVVFGKPVTSFPEWWGAAGDGTTDDSVAVRAAVTALDAGGAVKFSRVGYKVTEPAPSTACITIAKSKTTVFSDNKAKILYGGTASGVPIIQATGLSQVCVKGLEVDGNNAAKHFGIFLQQCTNSQIIHNYVHNLNMDNHDEAGQAIVVLGTTTDIPSNIDSYDNMVIGNRVDSPGNIHIVCSKNVIVEGNNSTNSWDTGIDIDCCQNMTIQGNRVDTAGDVAIFVNNSQIHTFPSKNIVINGNITSASNQGVSVNALYTGGAQNVVIDGCIDDGSNYNFVLTGDSITLANCIAKNAGAGACIADNGGSYHTISNFQGIGLSGNSAWGLEFMPAGTVTNLNVNNCVFKNLGYDAIGQLVSGTTGTISNVTADACRCLAGATGVLAAGLRMINCEGKNLTLSLLESNSHFANVNMSCIPSTIVAGAASEHDLGIPGFSGVKILAGVADPTTGIAAPIGSIYLHSAWGRIYQKTGAGDTAWTYNNP
jgi:polygalacturonase